MKKSIQLLLALTCVFMLVGFTTTNVFGQNATSMWALSSTTFMTAATTGNVTAQSQDTLGYRLRDYSGTNSSQRGGSSDMAAGTYGGWPAIETGPQANRYMDFKVTPNTGNDLILSSISLAVGNSGGSNNLRADISISTNGTTWTTLESVTIPNTAMTTKTYTTSLPRVNFGDTLRVRVSPWAVAAVASGKYFNIQNVVVSGTTITAGLSPIIVTTGTLSDFGSTTVNATSSEQSYTVSGTDLISDLVMTAPANFEISTTSGSGFNSSITLTPSGGSIATTNVYVRFAPLSTGIKSGNITHTSTAASTQNVAASGIGVNIPTLNTPTVSAVTINSATLGGTIVSDNGSTVTASGVAYAVSINPTSPTVETSPLVGSGALTVDVTGLSSNTLYHYRAYAANAVGTGYASDTAFTTFSNAPTANAATAIGAAGFTANWNAVSGSEAVSYRFDVSADSGFGSFVTGYENLTVAGTTQAVTGLSSLTAYYYRVRAVNAAGTSDNSAIITVVTLGSSVPLVESPTSSNIAAATATLGANVTSNGNSTLIEKGVVWSLSNNPTTADTKVIEGTIATGVYTVPATGLPSATVVHYRGYAINSIGTGYTSDATILTLANEPSTAAGSLNASVISNYRIDLSWTTATGANGYIILQRTGADPTGLPADSIAYFVGNTIGDAIVAAVVPSGDTTSVSITGLTTGIDYHFSIIPYAWNGVYTGTYNYKTDGTIPATNVTIIAWPYRSFASGKWSAAGSWEKFDGSTWAAATVFPNSTDGTITILGGHTITLDTNVTIDQVAVDASGTIKIDSARTLTIANGADPVDMQVNGTMMNYGTVTATGALAFGNGGLYNHALVAGSLPTATWETGSTCLITGTTGATPGNIIQNFYNFTWDCPGQSTNLNLAWDNVTINGDLTCRATGIAAAAQLRLTNAATIRTITLMGNVIVDGGYLTVSGSSGAAQYNTAVFGSIIIKAGKFNLCGGSGGFGTWKLCGDSLSIWPGAQFVVPSNKTFNTILYFAKNSGMQIYRNLGTNANLNYGVDSAATVQLISPLAIGSGSSQGFLALKNGTFVSSSTNLITFTSFSTDTLSNSLGYVNGPVAVTVASASPSVRRFPIGKDTEYRPVVLNVTQNAATSTTYKAEIFNSAPAARTLPVGLDAVSSVRYVNISKGTGATVVNPTSIQLSYGIDDNITDSSLVRIAMDDGAGTWVNIGGSGTANTTGTIISDVFNTFSTNDFVIAHRDITVATVPPSDTTMPVTYISTTFATSGGIVLNSGNDAVTARGVCWSTVTTPTIADSKTADGSGSGAFTSSITGLTAGQTYYLRAYATNSAGTGYGNEVSFTTLAALAAPAVITDSVSNIVNTEAVGYGNVTEWGGTAITARGICWSTSHNPTTSNDNNTNGTTEGKYTAPIGGLTLGATYYVRAFATNNVGTSYGSEVSFTTPEPQPDVYKLVAKDGSGDYTTVQAAFDAVQLNYTGHWYIKVKSGQYYEKLLLSAGKINVVLVGENPNPDSTVLWYDDYAGKNAFSNGTNTSYSVAIDAADFQAQNITFKNTANAYAPGSPATQAVALRTNGDRQVYFNCKMLGYQDTYYTWGGSSTGPDRIYNKKCYVEGSVDFIFGRDVVVFDSCIIFCNRNGGVLTAAATEPGFKFGYVFLHDSIASTAAGDLGVDGNPMVSFYLGRPWQQAPKTVFDSCYEPATVNAAGWTLMGPNPALYSEYGCYGPGYVTTRPVIWTGTSQPSKIADTIAATYTISNIFAKTTAAAPYSYSANWLPQILDVSSIITGVSTHADNSIATDFELRNNFPNPFNPSTQIQFSVPKDGHVTLKVYNLVGQEVATLFDGIAKSGQFITKEFSGNRLASGVYFARLQFNGNSLVRRMMLLK
jgi:pectin methylesterase-like acyl-CoA thioesterase